MPPDRKRSRRESGFTLLEAVLVVSITALATATLFSLIGRSTARTWNQADHAISVVEAANAEAELRAMLAARQALAGDSSRVVLEASLAQSTRCAQSGGARQVRIFVLDRSLECESGGRRRTLLSWRRGEGRLSYSAADGAWRDRWSADGPVVVRFQLSDGTHTLLEWALRGGERAPDDGARIP